MVQAQVSVGGQGPRRYLLGLGRLESNTRPYGLDDRLNCMPHSPLPLLSLYAHTLSLLVHKCVGGRPPPPFRLHLSFSCPPSPSQGVNQSQIKIHATQTNHTASYNPPAPLPLTHLSTQPSQRALPCPQRTHAGSSPCAAV